MQNDRVEGLLQQALAISGPVAAYLLARGVDQTTVNLIIEMALLIVPPFGSAAWRWVRSRLDKTAIRVSNIPGVEVRVDTTAASSAPPELIAIAKDTTSNPNVIPKGVST